MLMKFGGHLLGAGDVGVGMPKADPWKFEQEMVALLGCSDKDHAGCKKTRRSVNSKVVFVDGCQLFSQVKSQAIETIISGEA